MRQVALDLCKGLGGWTKGLQAAGWLVAGVDTEDYSLMPDYVVPDFFLQANVLDIAKDPQAFFPGIKFDLVVASPPCQEFSYRSFPFKRCQYLRDNVPPNKNLWNACKEIADKLGCPIVIENVRGAVRYMGSPANRYGPFYLWGDVPLLLPDGKTIRKGFGKVNADTWANKKRFKRGESQFTSSKSKARKEWSAKIAMIPFDLSFFIGDHFLRNLPQ